MELFFEVQREKTHIMVDTRENGTVADIKQLIASITNVPIGDIALKRPTNDARTAWETMEDQKSLLELGFTQKNAKPDEPFLLTYTLPGDNSVQLEPLSDPPPMPEQMQNPGDNAGDA
ncbi:hypothetical protein M3Y99_01099000 [Aphelenchoides fujianensis]|nr:hypothetical protein M3Y99_01099000 [Aphelenchoides fujianensis]